MKRVFSLLRPYLNKQSGTIIALAILSLIAGGVSTVSPYISGRFIDFLISPDNNSSMLALYCLSFLGASCAGLILNYIINLEKVRVSNQISYCINRKAIEHIHSLPSNEIDDKDPAATTQKINNDSFQTASYCIGVICNVIVNALTALVPFCLVALIDIRAAAFVIVFACIYIVTYAQTKEGLYRTGFDFREAQAYFFGRLNEHLVHYQFIKDNSISSILLGHLDDSFERLLNKTLAYQKKSYIFSGLDSLIIVLSQIAMFILGGAMVFSNEITVGEFTMLSSYTSISLSSIRYFFGLGKETQNALVSCDRLTTIFSVSPSRNGSAVIDNPFPIRISNLSLKNEDRTLIRHMNYTFEKDTLYLITGPNGCGKTTFAHLLLCEEPTLAIDGAITLGGVNSTSINSAEYRKSIVSYCEQRPVILSDTILFNLTLGNDVNTELMNKLLLAFDLKDKIESLKEGLNTQVSPSFGFSGGEAQKIAIIRSILSEKPVLIFDEPTSALDHESKISLMRFLASYKMNRSILVISHDNELTQYCDVSLPGEIFHEEK